MNSSGNTSKHREDLSETFSGLLSEYSSDIQRELNVTRAPGCPPADKLLLLIVSQSSPLASLTKNEELHDGVSVRLLTKDVVLGAVKDAYPALAHRIKTAPKCGHLHYLASIKRGVLTLCVECDLGLKPKK